MSSSQIPTQSRHKHEASLNQIIEEQEGSLSNLTDAASYHGSSISLQDINRNAYEEDIHAVEDGRTYCSDGNQSKTASLRKKTNRFEGKESEMYSDLSFSSSTQHGGISREGSVHTSTGNEPSVTTSKPFIGGENEKVTVSLLSSYVSEPASTLQAWRVIAQEEEKALKGEANVALSIIPEDTQSLPATMMPSPFSFDSAPRPIRDHAFLHEVGSKPQRDKQHSYIAGDLAVSTASEEAMQNQVAIQARKLIEGGHIKGNIVPPSHQAVIDSKQKIEKSEKLESEGMLALPKRLPRLRILGRSPKKVNRPENEEDDGTSRAHGKSFKDNYFKQEKNFEETGTPGRKLSSHSEFLVEEKNPKRYNRKLVWQILISLAIIFIFSVVGICLVVFAPSAFLNNFQFWRLSFFIAGLPVIWWLGLGIANLVVWSVQRTMFSVKHALYFSSGLQYPLRNVIRAALTLGWWALIMTVETKEQSDDVNRAYNIVLRIWACVTLFMVANLIKRMIAKMLALRYNKAQHLDRLTDAEKHETILRQLLNAPSSRHFLKDGKDQEDNKFLRSGYTWADILHLRKTQSVDNFLNSEKNYFSEPAKLEKRHSRQKSIFRFFKRERVLHSIHEEGNAISSDGDLGDAGNRSVQRPGSPSVRIELNSPTNSPTLPHASLSPKSLALKKLENFRSFRDNVEISVHTGKDGQLRSPIVSDNKSYSPKSNLGTDIEHRSAVSVAPSFSRFGNRDNPIPNHQFMKELSNLEKHIRKNSLQFTWRDEMNRKSSAVIDSEEEANRVGEYLYLRLNDLRFEYREGIPQSRLEEVFHPDEAEEAFKMLDVDNSGLISKNDCIAAVLAIYQERKNLAKSLQDVRSITSVLETLIGIVIHILFVFFYLLIFEADIGQLWISFSSVILAFSFMFGNSVRAVYENVVFLFGCHPYDIGDMLYFDDNYFTVDEITITFTVCMTSDGQRVWIPNQKLLGMSFVNLSVSGNRCESIRVLVDIDTPPETLDVLRQALEDLRIKHEKEFASFAVSFREVSVAMKMTIFIWIEFAFNGTDIGRCSQARTLVHICLARTLKELGVSYTLPPQAPFNDQPAKTGIVGEKLTGMKLS